LTAQLNRTSAVSPQCQLQTNAPFNIWVNQSQFAADNLPCWVDNMKLVVDPVTLQYSNMPGVNIQPIAGTQAVEFADPTDNNSVYMETLIQYLENQGGYARGHNILAAPFDWRFAPFLNSSDPYFVGLKQMIETTSANLGSKVCMLTHSLGYADSCWSY
jgi:hypothetical protein